MVDSFKCATSAKLVVKITYLYSIIHTWSKVQQCIITKYIHLQYNVFKICLSCNEHTFCENTRCIYLYHGLMYYTAINSDTTRIFQYSVDM